MAGGSREAGEAPCFSPCSIRAGFGHQAVGNQGHRNPVTGTAKAETRAGCGFPGGPARAWKSFNLFKTNYLVAIHQGFPEVRQGLVTACPGG